METEANIDIADARDKIGRLWGLDRPLTYAELGRALKLAATGGEYLSRVEKGKSAASGPIYVAIELMLKGIAPGHVGDIVKPGYPRVGK